MQIPGAQLLVLPAVMIRGGQSSRLTSMKLPAPPLRSLTLSLRGHTELLAVKTPGCQSDRLTFLTSRLPAQLGQPQSI